MIQQANNQSEDEFARVPPPKVSAEAKRDEVIPAPTEIAVPNPSVSPTSEASAPTAPEAPSPSAIPISEVMGLLATKTTNQRLATDVFTNRWVGVLRLTMAAKQNDVLLIRAVHQVSTEDNLVLFSGRILVNDQDVGLTSIFTGAQPDGTGGNHHLPVDAMALYRVKLSANYDVKFQIMANVVSAKRGQNKIDPISTTDTLRYGQMFIERYGKSSDGEKPMFAADFTSNQLGASGRTPCCQNVTFRPVIESNVTASPGDVLLLSGQLTAWHNAERPNPNILDGEQIANVLTLAGVGASAYVGENVTRLNPVVSVFNESLVTLTNTNPKIGNYSSSNFGNGAYFENNATELRALRFSLTQGQPFFSAASSEITATNLSSLQTTLWNQPIPNLKTGSLVRLSAKINLSNLSQVGDCELTLQYDQKTSKTFKYLSSKYPRGSVRLELLVAVNEIATPRLIAQCSANAARVENGEIQVIMYQK